MKKTDNYVLSCGRKTVRLLLLALMAWSSLTAMGEERQPAFPGAEGFGRYVTGGRGGKVYHVTSLDDDGSEGTLRWAVEQSDTRTIVFDVDGTIHLQSKLDLTNGNVTLAGQTAPGDGICVADYPFSIKANNVILRYMRFRLGNQHATLDDADGWDGLGALDQKNIIIDHCSVSWSIDECLSMSGCENITVQWCLVAQSLQESVHSKGAHGYGGNWGGKHASYHHNLLAHHGSRTPRLGPRPTTQLEEYMDMRNNVIYNWAGNGCYGGEAMKVNIVNNYYKPGPATDKRGQGNPLIPKRIAGVGIRTNDYIKTYPAYADALHIWGRYYVDGNVNPDHQDVTSDNWTYGMYNQIDQNGNDGTYTEQVKQEIRLGSPLDYYLTTTHSASDAYERVLAYAGASLHRDSHDQTMVSDTRNKKATYTGTRSGILPGMIDSQDETGGWPTLSSGTPLEDTDGDGMPDTWEDANGLDKNDDTDGAEVNADGYTNLEHYLNSLVADITTLQNAGGTAAGTTEEASTEMVVADGYQIDASTKTAESASDGVNTWEFEEGFTVTNANGKGYSTGKYNTLKYSKGTQFTIHIPSGLAIEKVTFTGYGNEDKAAFLAELGGTQYGSDQYVFHSGANTSEEYTITLASHATKTLTFKPGDTQACWKITLHPVKNEQTATGGTSIEVQKTVSGTVSLPMSEGQAPHTVNYSDEASGRLTATYALGTKMDEVLYKGGVCEINGTPFTMLQPTEKITSADAGHAVNLTLSAGDGIKFKPTAVSFYASRVGTDGGDIDLYLDGSKVTTFSAINRNKEENGFSSELSQDLSSTASGSHTLSFRIYKLATNKQLALANIVITGDLTYTETSTTGQARQVVLKEDARALDVEEGYADVTLHRQLGTSWNTLCLPFSLSAAQIAAVWGKTEIYELKGVSGTVLHFSPVTRIQAGVPCLIKVERVVSQPVFSGVIISALSPTSTSAGDYSLEGTYVRYGMATDGTELMMQTSGQLARPTASPNNWLRGMRAYFKVPAQVAGQAKVSFLGVETSVSDLGMEPADEAILYDLQGRRVRNPRRGIYIRRGQKIIVE